MTSYFLLWVGGSESHEGVLCVTLVCVTYSIVSLPFQLMVYTRPLMLSSVPTRLVVLVAALEAVSALRTEVARKGAAKTKAHRVDFEWQGLIGIFVFRGFLKPPC